MQYRIIYHVWSQYKCVNTTNSVAVGHGIVMNRVAIYYYYQYYYLELKPTITDNAYNNIWLGQDIYIYIYIYIYLYSKISLADYPSTTPLCRSHYL